MNRSYTPAPRPHDLLIIGQLGFVRTATTLYVRLMLGRWG